MLLFHRKEIEIKSKYLNTPWKTNRLRKYSKCKQHLYEKYLKIRSKENKLTHKAYKNLFKKIKICTENYYQEKIKFFENDVRNTK